MRVDWLAIAGILVAIAPEFIMLLLGEKWLPMLDTFRLMLVFSMLDPIKITVASVLVAVGQPNLVGQARAIQLVVLIIGLLILTPLLETVGVALAVDIMLVVGLGIMFSFVSRYVDFSLRRLFLVPLIGIIFGVGLAFLLPTSDNLILSLVNKVAAFTLVYFVILLIFDRKQLLEFIGPLKEMVRARMAK